VNGERVAALSEKTHLRPRHVLLVADGMGGHVGGAIASDIAMAFLEAEASGLVDAKSSAALVKAANRAVHVAADQSPDLRGMGTTIAGVVATASEVVWFNVGDSRIYLVGASGLRRLSVDHSIGSALTQALGGSSRPTEVWPACGVEPWRPGDRVLLCSDGLTNLVEDAELEQLMLGAGDDDAELVSTLLKLTFIRDAPDNVTVVLATNDSDGAAYPR
jgi:protein phosphatase